VVDGEFAGTSSRCECSAGKGLNFRRWSPLNNLVSQFQTTMSAACSGITRYPRRPGWSVVFMLVLLVALGTRPVAAADKTVVEVYAPFQALLASHLVERALPGGGLVSAFDYEAALEDPRTEALLTRQNRVLADFDPAALTSRDMAIAFWINAYNYFMIEYILRNPQHGGLIDSVRDYGSLFNPYRVFRRKVFNVGGQDFSLDDIEKGILLGEDYQRKGWKDARIHFAVNCASVGCPPLRARIYRPDTLDTMLTDSTRGALGTRRHLHLEGDTLFLSQLFDWYEQDYVEQNGSLMAFIRAYVDDNLRACLERAPRIRFIDYDWSLNSPENFPEFRDSPRSDRN
jgi:hypothetical protein